MANYPQIFDEIGYGLREKAHKHADLAFRFDCAVRAVRIAETLEEERRALNALAVVHLEVIAASGAALEAACRAQLSGLKKAFEPNLDRVSRFLSNCEYEKRGLR